MEVLLHFRDARTGRSLGSDVARVAATKRDYVTDLKKRVRLLSGFPAAADVFVLFNGQRLDDYDTLDKCGVTASRGTEQWAESFVYPNGWFLLGHRKANPKVGSGCSWTSLRSSALEKGAVRGAWVLLLLICLCNTLLALTGRS